MFVVCSYGLCLVQNWSNESLKTKVITKQNGIAVPRFDVAPDVPLAYVVSTLCLCLHLSAFVRIYLRPTLLWRQDRRNLSHVKKKQSSPRTEGRAFDADPIRLTPKNPRPKPGGVFLRNFRVNFIMTGRRPEL